jgi:hypothetical protein
VPAQRRAAAFASAFADMGNGARRLATFSEM